MDLADPPNIEKLSAVKTPSWIQERPTPQSATTLWSHALSNGEQSPLNCASPQCRHDVQDLPRLYIHHDAHNQQPTES